MIRFFDVVISVFVLFITLPFLLMISFCIMLDKSGKVLFIQERVGKNGKIFKIFKFRTMIPDAQKSGFLTVGNKDKRITKIGSFLREYKIDELPQLLNVLKGDMSIVGPRPEVQKYTDLYTEFQKKILQVKPGITDYASIKYYNENQLLKESNNPEKTYIEEIMPKKILLNLSYSENPNVSDYFKVIFLTILKIINH